jgi:transposase
MKFKSSTSINQRIERISTEHLVVGIDIAKEKHVAQAVNYRGLVRGRPLSFNNDLTGFERLQAWVQKLQRKHGLTAAIIGLESTGHYWFNLANWLTEHEMEVVLVNPMTTKRNKENRDNSQSKNDVKDALTIADAVSRGYYGEWKQQDELYHRLRVIVDEREYWSDQQVNLKNRIQRCLDIVFPEYTRIFKDWTCPRSIATLKAFPLPSDLKKVSAEKVIEGWRREGFKRAGGNTGIQKAIELIDQASYSVGSTASLEERRRELTRLVKEYERSIGLMDQMNQEIEILLQTIPLVTEQMQSIKGLSPLFIAVILANAGDLSQYKHGRQLLSQAGLNLAESTSGKKRGQIVISKRGRRQLRKYLYLAVIGLVRNNSTFKEWHKQNVQVQKMKKQRSIFKLIGKLARILIAMARNKESFTPSKASRIQELITA